VRDRPRWARRALAGSPTHADYSVARRRLDVQHTTDLWLVPWQPDLQVGQGAGRPGAMERLNQPNSAPCTRRLIAASCTATPINSSWIFRDDNDPLFRPRNDRLEQAFLAGAARARPVDLKALAVSAVMRAFYL